MTIKAIETKEYINKHGKPSVHDTFLINIKDRTGEHTYISPVFDFRVVFRKGGTPLLQPSPAMKKAFGEKLKNPNEYVEFVLPIEFPQELQPPISILLTATDDPTVEEAQNWVSIGHNRILFNLQHAGANRREKEGWRIVGYHDFWQHRQTIPEL